MLFTEISKAELITIITPSTIYSVKEYYFSIKVEVKDGYDPSFFTFSYNKKGEIEINKTGKSYCFIKTADDSYLNLELKSNSTPDIIVTKTSPNDFIYNDNLLYSESMTEKIKQLKVEDLSAKIHKTYHDKPLEVVNSFNDAIVTDFRNQYNRVRTDN